MVYFDLFEEGKQPSPRRMRQLPSQTGSDHRHVMFSVRGEKDTVIRDNVNIMIRLTYRMEQWVLKR